MNTLQRIIVLIQLSKGLVSGQCDSPLGMEDGRIPDSRITATTEQNPAHSPSNARLNNMGGRGAFGGWSAGTSDKGQWIQVDLGDITKVTRIATQNRYRYYRWVTEYKVSYSLDGGYFVFYHQPPENTTRVFQGNKDKETVVANTFHPPIIARFIRLHPVKWYRSISLRMELYGCRSGFPTPPLPVCEAGLGLEGSALPDSALTASSEYGSDYGPANGRLYFQPKSGRVGAWKASSNNNGNWFRVQFVDWTKVTRVATQGRQDKDQWVTKYHLSYSYDGLFFQDYKEGDVVKIFDGNSDRYTVVSHELRNPIITRYIRINPVSYFGWISLRADFYGCYSGFPIPEVPSCRKPLGMESGRILNSAITASTVWPGYQSYKARLSAKAGWFASKQNPHQWLQVDFGTLTQVTAISTQGYYYGNSWMKRYTLSYSNTGLDPFTPYQQQSLKKIFTGNVDSNSIVSHLLSPYITTRFIRIIAVKWNRYIALRVEFYGCREGFPVPKISACRRPLGDQIRNDSITVSSQKSPIDGRVNVGLGSNRRSWIPQKSDKNQWLQVDLGNKMQITGIATQGHHNGSFWVKRYSLQHSNNGVSFESYAPERQPKIFSGNTDYKNTVSHELIPPIRARYLRIIPESWNAEIALRIEFYGCSKKNGNFSRWSDWSPCSVTCGLGSRSRHRSCTNPPPGRYGDDCSHLGNDTQKIQCNLTSCQGSTRIITYVFTSAGILVTSALFAGLFKNYFFLKKRNPKPAESFALNSLTTRS